MLMQYVLDNCITSVLPWSLIVSRQPARFASPRASRRRLSAPPIPPRPIRQLTLSTDRPFEVLSGRFRHGRKKQRKCPHFAQFWCNLSTLDATLPSHPLCVANKGLVQYLSLLDATLTKTGGGGLVAQPIPCPERNRGMAVLFRWSRNTAHGTRNAATPRIMCAPLQESTPCTIASSAAPDGTSVKLVTACGDSPAGAARTTPNRSKPSSAPWISAAISLTPRGPTAPATASRSSGKFCAPALAKDSTSPRKFR